ncbi:lactadherin-like [Patiria miniata]|uniref:F5/8 type C domain-containing protein n=1 Tax=Patiria miniata TaxID=46514 RepID=A0A914AAV5_PATMI|nr:lactadherin-like [Patiria miniata]
MDGAAALVLVLSAMAAGTEKPIQAGAGIPTPAATEKPTTTVTGKPTPTVTEKPTPADTENPTPAVCSSPQPLGIEDGNIQDDRITASSSRDCCRASYGRLNNNEKWSPMTDEANPWIEVDLIQSTVVTGVTTQGGLGRWYVKRYKVAYQQQPSFQRKHVTDGNGDIKVFIGNTNTNNPVTNLFDESVVATVVRIEPTKWQFGVSLRLELLGCRCG